MSSAPQGQWLKGQRLQAQRGEADRAPAVRNIRIPGLNWVLGRALELIA